MFIEGRPEFFHCFLWAAVFWWKKCLATQGALVRERLALDILADFKLRFFYCFLLPSGRAPCRAPLESRVIVTCQIRARICPGRRGIILIIGGRRLIKFEVRLVKKKKNQSTWDEAPTTSYNQSKGGLCLSLRSRSGA